MRNKIFKITFLLAAVVFLSSCLKDEVGEDWTDSLAGKMYAEVWQAGFKATSLAPVAEPDTFKFMVNIATDALPTSDITLTLGVDESLIGKYNDQKGTNYKLYPYIEILQPTIVIKAGTRNAYVHVKVWNADQLNACDNYMAPIAITDATGGVVVSDPMNQGARLMALPISNPYAGDYQTDGYRLHPSLGVLPVSAVQTLSTINCKKVTKSGFGDYPYDVEIEVTETTIVVQGVTCYKVIAHTIDPATGSPVASGEGMYDTFNGDPTANPIPETNDVNYYNPVEKMFVLNLYYNSAAPRKMYEHLVRL